MSTTPGAQARPIDAPDAVAVPRPRTAQQLLTCRQARTPEALAEHHAIRHQVFVAEQGMFVASDQDLHDRDGATIRIVGYLEDTAAGTVRLFELDHGSGLWQGDRLAVLPEYRTHGVGAPLVRSAVATAGALGGHEMVAHIQLPNVRFFTRLGWVPSGEPEIYAGRPHQQMRIALPDVEQGAALADALAHGSLDHP